LDAGDSVTVNSNSDDDAEDDDAGDGNDLTPPALLLPLVLPMVAGFAVLPLQSHGVGGVMERRGGGGQHSEEEEPRRREQKVKTFRG